ncbi:MAG: ABC transporter ATP-binding protein [Sphingomonas sp.]
MSLEVRDVSLSYGSLEVLRDCSLQAAQGELICLVGPSGCGKTTLLNVIAGILAPDSGTVSVGGEVVDALPTRERRLAYIMDRLGLYPHLSVFENIAYPLRIRRVPSRELTARVEGICREVGLTGLEQRRPHQLSAGQQQRVAIARALVRDDAQLLLADESFSSLDAQLRHELRSSFRRWQRERGVTSLFVTHDQEEALSLGDRVALMRAGTIEQIGTAAELYGDPRTLFTVKFFGVPRCNIARAVLADGQLSRFGLAFKAARPDLLGKAPAPDRLSLAFRPETVVLGEPEAHSIAMTVEWVELAGPDSIVHLTGPEAPVAVRVRGTPDLRPGASVGISVPSESWMAFDDATGVRVN